VIRCRCGIEESVCMRQQQREESSEPCDDRLAARYAELGITLCPDCDEPTHATESDDTGRCASCRPPIARTPRVISCGGGLDSFAMLLGAIEGSYEVDALVFIDTGAPGDPGEWPGTYKHLDEVVRPLCEKHGIEYVRIDHTNYPVRDARSLFAWHEARGSMPMAAPGRICTTIAKVERFEAWLTDRFPGQEVEVWIGFEKGEEKRAAKDPNSGTTRKAKPGAATRRNRFPLIEWGLCRCRCEAMVRASGHPVPRKSACVYCPYASKGDWQRFAVELPEQFARVVELERNRPVTKIQPDKKNGGMKGGNKLSIMAYRSGGPGVGNGKATPLPEFIAGSYTRTVEPCSVCGSADRATKATGCGYLDDNDNTNAALAAQEI
jgi:hypothetical protein